MAQDPPIHQDYSTPSLRYAHVPAVLEVKAINVTKPYEFIGFGAIDVTKPYRSIGFGALDVTKPYTFTRFGAIDVTKIKGQIKFPPGSVPKSIKYHRFP